MEFNSDFICYLNKQFLSSEIFVNYLKNNRAVNWDLSEIINNLSNNNVNKIIKELNNSEKKSLINMNKYCKRNDYQNIDYLNCKYLMWVIDYEIINLSEIDNNLLNKKMGPDENTLINYAFKKGDLILAYKFLKNIRSIKNLMSNSL